MTGRVKYEFTESNCHGEPFKASVKKYLEDSFEGLILGSLELYDLPAEVTAFYYLGEVSTMGLVRQLQADADRYYQAASRGSFSPPLKRPGRTFAELCRARGDFALADRVEADLNAFTFNLGGA